MNNKNKTLTLLWRVLRLSRPYRKFLYLASILSVLLAIISPLRPWLIQLTVDEYILPRKPELFQPLLIMTLILIASLLLETAFRYYFIFTTNWLGQSIIRDLRTRVFDHIIHLRLRYFDRTPIGTSTTRTINDVETINE